MVMEQPELQSEEAEFRDGKTTVKRTYTAKASTALEAQAAARAKAAPAGLTALSATTRYTDAAKSRTRFTVEIDYGNATASALQQQEQAETNPLDWEPKISYPTEEGEETYFEDCAETAQKVLNSAKQPFDNLRPRRRSRMVIQVEVNVADNDFDPLDIAHFADTTNNAPVTIDGVTYPANTLLMTAPQASAKQKWKTVEIVDEEPQEVTVEYRTITYRLLIDPDGSWLDEVADVGYDELISGKWVPIVDEHGQKVTKPFPLNGEGRKATGAPATLQFVPYYSETWPAII
jgi:hypothetical protein